MKSEDETHGGTELIAAMEPPVGNAAGREEMPDQHRKRGAAALRHLLQFRSTFEDQSWETEMTSCHGGNGRLDDGKPRLIALRVGRSIAAAQEAAHSQRMIGIILQKDAAAEEPTPEQPEPSLPCWVTSDGRHRCMAYPFATCARSL